LFIPHWPWCSFITDTNVLLYIETYVFKVNHVIQSKKLFFSLYFDKNIDYVWYVSDRVKNLMIFCQCEFIIMTRFSHVNLPVIMAFKIVSLCCHTFLPFTIPLLEHSRRPFLATSLTTVVITSFTSSYWNLHPFNGAFILGDRWQLAGLHL